MSSDTIRIRRPTMDDLIAIINVHRTAIEGKAAGHYSPEQIASWTKRFSLESLGERVEREAQNLADAQIIGFVADLEGDVIGFSMVVPAKNELRAVYVAPGDWRGVGGMLLEKAEEEARRLKASHLVCDSSLNAEGFYAKHGYGVIERTAHTLQDGTEIPCVRMRKEF